MDTTELQEHQLVQTKHGDLLKVSTIYNRDHVTAQVLYVNGGGVPDRTLVRSYTAAMVAEWKPASTQLINKSDDAWGFNNPDR